MKGTSKLPSRHLSADRPLQRLRGCFLGDNAAVPPAYRVKVEKCASFVDILDVCKFTTFCDRKGYTALFLPARNWVARGLADPRAGLSKCRPYFA